MRHGNKVNRLNREASHRRAMLNNLATSILGRGLNDEPMERQVVTTVPKAKAVRGVVERLITYAKRGDLAARRQAARFVKDKEVLQGLFETLAKRYGNRAGGYTRVLKLATNRHGDNAAMAVVSLVEEEVRVKTRKKPSRPTQAKRKVNITKAEEGAANPSDAASAAGAPESSQP